MAITSMGDRDVENDPTEKLPVLSDAVPELPPSTPVTAAGLPPRAESPATGSVPEAIDRAMLADLPVLTEQWHSISHDLRVDLPLLTDALSANDAESDSLAAAREQQLTETLEQFERLKEQAVRVREALAAQQASAPVAAQPAATASELEQLAALQDYVTGRKHWWHDMEREVESARLRIRELEIELAQRSARQIAAEARADRHSERAGRLRGQLASSARELQRLREQLHHGGQGAELDEATVPAPAAATPGPADVVDAADSGGVEVRREHFVTVGQARTA
jgi:hypothetical protein